METAASTKHKILGNQLLAALPVSFGQIGARIALLKAWFGSSGPQGKTGAKRWNVSVDSLRCLFTVLPLDFFSTIKYCLANGCEDMTIVVDELKQGGQPHRRAKKKRIGDVLREKGAVSQ